MAAHENGSESTGDEESTDGESDEGDRGDPYNLQDEMEESFLKSGGGPQTLIDSVLAASRGGVCAEGGSIVSVEVGGQLNLFRKRKDWQNAWWMLGPQVFFVVCKDARATANKLKVELHARGGLFGATLGETTSGVFLVAGELSGQERGLMLTSAVIGGRKDPKKFLASALAVAEPLNTQRSFLSYRHLHR